MTVVILVLAGLLIWAMFDSISSTTFKCRKCGFTTDDPLRAAGHVATENKHACDEI